MNYLQTPLPEKTKSYAPVGHKELIEFVEARLDAAKFKRTTMSVDQNKEGTIIVANMGIQRKEVKDFHQEFSIINSYNKSKPVTFASGARVFVCENGMIISEAVTVRRHTTNVWNELGEKADTAIAQLEANWQKTLADVNKMKEVELTMTRASELMGRIFVEEKILRPTEVTTAVRELRKPSFGEFAALTLWSMYNACTYALKEAHAYRKNDSLKSLHDFCLKVAE